MTAPRRFFALLVLAGMMAAACSGSGGGTETPSVTETTDESPTPVETATSGPPGTAVYVYENAGVTVTVRLEGSTGTLEIVNETGRELPRPDLYVKDARDGRQIDGRVPGATPVSAGATATFDVVFPPAMDIENIGLLVLLIGSDNYGAFVRQ